MGVWTPEGIRAEDSTIRLQLESTLFGYANPDDNYDVITHEAVHSLDYVNADSGDGIPTSMSEQDAKVFREERARLFDIAYPDASNLDISSPADDLEVSNNSGLTDYAFANEREFLSRTSELFLSSPAGAEAVKNASPKIYNILRTYYNRTDLPVAEIGGPSLPASPGIAKPWYAISTEPKLAAG